jgi:hypothetical protein
MTDAAPTPQPKGNEMDEPGEILLVLGFLVTMTVLILWLVARICAHAYFGVKRGYDRRDRRDRRRR